MDPPLSYDAARNTGINMNPSQPFRTDVPIRRKSPPRTSMRSASLEPAKLQKPDSGHARASSGQFLSPSTPHTGKLQKAGHNAALLPVSPTAMGAMQSFSSPHDRPLPMTPNSATGSRPVTPVYTVTKGLPDTPPSSNASVTNEKKKHGWFGKKKDKHEEHAPVAWIAGQQDKVAYDIHSLMQGSRTPEVWKEKGNCFIHLFPPNFDKGASFKVDARVFEASPVLTHAAFGDNPVPYQEVHLYLQLKLTHAAIIHGSAHATSEPTVEDLQTIVDFRNLFAFLCGQALVSTEKRSSLFSILVAVGSLLRAYEFSNADASTFGDVADANFTQYAEDYGLADVRTSREKTIQGIVLGERMRSASLYTESFTHAVGKLNDILALNNPKFGMISEATKTRLTRASLDLEKRQQAVQLTLKDFDFPSIFSGIMNSKTAEERKEGVRFMAWKEAFLNTRKWMLSTLKHQYGDWPPKAKSKKNDLEVSGLQRQVLRQLYLDLCSMYDLLVDRSQLTTRTLDGIDRAGPVELPWIRALRSVLSEYDRSSPPVKPPVPFDLPRIPSWSATRPDFGSTIKLKDDEIARLLRGSWNDDVIVTPFVNAFRDMERRATHGCTLQEIVDLRIGQWIFMYAVMQALPMLACDAPGLKYKQNVEYFLCEAPRDGMPWYDPSKVNLRKTWFSVGDAGNVVSMPAHIIEHSTEGIYRRSHCWEMAEQWAAANPILNAALHEQNASAAASTIEDLPVPRVHTRSRSASPVSRAYRNSSLNLGLEVLSLPPGTTPTEERKSAEPLQSAHKVDSNKTFDAIFATMPTTNVTSKKKSTLSK
ncbi:hypothetical protein AMS68_001710 [Peltaster fructicola]|uniref:DUF8004 domain-containing protein n=1 Tax=Peltaster fructicola TaxID=286661 RepID=A0A6H0XN93_9PEZI|nr:hypothetical protein AMS68_001710 [Peltaster fructicola]